MRVFRLDAMDVCRLFIYSRTKGMGSKLWRKTSDKESNKDALWRSSKYMIFVDMTYVIVTAIYCPRSV